MFKLHNLLQYILSFVILAYSEVLLTFDNDHTYHFGLHCNPHSFSGNLKMHYHVLEGTVQEEVPVSESLKNGMWRRDDREKSEMLKGLRSLTVIQLSARRQ